MQTAAQTLNLWLYFPDFSLSTISCIDALTYLWEDNHGFFLQLYHGGMALNDFPPLILCSSGKSKTQHLLVKYFKIQGENALYKQQCADDDK